MKEQLSSMVRFCVIAGLSIAVFGGGAEAANKSWRECQRDWRAHKAMYRSEGKTKTAFMSTMPRSDICCSKEGRHRQNILRQRSEQAKS